MEIDLLSYEKDLYLKGYHLIAGVDEAGRGPLCGPVVASAVILPENYHLKGLNDSKKLTSKKRDELYDIIMKDAVSVGISIIDNDIIDEINILEASRLAMNNAIKDLKIKPDYILTDAMDLYKANVLPIIKGDQKSISIAAASVIAKVTRDRIMDDYDNKYPLYEFKNHKGYPTKKHLELIEKYGILDFYRKSYKPVKKILERKNNEIL